MSAQHFSNEAYESERVLVTALWGMVPRWHTGNYKKHGLTTNNARLENLSSSKLYKPALDKGRRAIIPVEGFYEWNTTNAKLKSTERPAYFIHMPQKAGVKIEDKSTWTSDDVNLMYLAGLFDVWKDDAGESLYSFTVLTFESDKHFNWLHHRTPAVLETKQQVSDWLDFKRVSTKDALKMIEHPKLFVWYEVSKYVNNSRNKTGTCNKPMDRKKIESSSVLSWVKNNKKESKEEGEAPSSKD